MAGTLHDIEADRHDLLRLLVRTGAFQHSPNKPFRLASGETSPYYFDLKRLNGDPEGISAVAKILYQVIRRLPDIKSVGGLESGSISIATAVSQLSWLEHKKNPSNLPLASFFVRKETKQHGTRKLVEGRAVSPAVIVDDVITSGMSSLVAIRAARKEEIQCSCLVSIIFRGTARQSQDIEKEIPLQYIFDRDTLLQRFKELAT